MPKRKTKAPDTMRLLACGTNPYAMLCMHATKPTHFTVCQPLPPLPASPGSHLAEDVPDAKFNHTKAKVGRKKKSTELQRKRKKGKHFGGADMEPKGPNLGTQFIQKGMIQPESEFYAARGTSPQKCKVQSLQCRITGNEIGVRRMRRGYNLPKHRIEDKVCKPSTIVRLEFVPGELIEKTSDLVLEFIIVLIASFDAHCLFKIRNWLPLTLAYKDSRDVNWTG